jgi:hypothetical protein
VKIVGRVLKTECSGKEQQLTYFVVEYGYKYGGGEWV